MGERIHVEEEALTELKQALETAGENYKSEIARLTNLMDEITSGDIQGDPADDLLAKFRAKEEDFKSLATAIEQAQEYAGVKGTSFKDMITEFKERAQ